MWAPRSLCPSSWYDSECSSASAISGLPIGHISSLSAAPVSLYSSCTAPAPQPWRSASSSFPSLQPAAAAAAAPQAAAQKQSFAAQKQSFAGAPALCYSPAEPAQKEPLGDVLKRAGKRC